MTARMGLLYMLSIAELASVGFCTSVHNRERKLVNALKWKCECGLEDAVDCDREGPGLVGGVKLVGAQSWPSKACKRCCTHSRKVRCVCACVPESVAVHVAACLGICLGSCMYLRGMKD
eukprot:scaffold9177_cov21-Tisochrysis_lutea.AAC.1